jgi:transcription antitermination factor NusG
MPCEVTGRSYVPATSIDSSGTARATATTFGSRGALLWYATYTRPRHEKRVAQQLAGKAVENYVPLYESARQWKNGRHIVQMPLFPGYVFVRIALRDQLDVLRVRGVVELVGSSGVPVPLEETEIISLRRALSQGGRAEPHPFITEGRKVRITAGPFAGLQGFVMRRKRSVQVVVSLELIQRSIRLEIDSTELEPLI